MKVLFRFLLFPLSLLRILLVAVITFFALIFVVLEDIFATRNGSYKFIVARLWARSILFFLGFIVRRNPRPRLPLFILMPNHRSYVDIFLMGAFSPSAFIAKAELSHWPLIGPALRHCRAIMVKRDSHKSLMGTLDAIKKSLDDNVSVTLFPEGTTTFGPGTKSFKSGSFKIAADLEIPVVPCAICYRDKDFAWVGDDPFILHFFRTMWKPFSVVDVHFGEPVISNDMEQLKEMVKESINKMLSLLE